MSMHWERSKRPACIDMVDRLSAYQQMTEPFQGSALLPALPEMVLAVGAMVLLMAAAFGIGGRARAIDTAAILLLIATAFLVLWLPEGKLLTFGGSFIVDDFARFLKLLALAGSAAAILMSFTYFASEKQQNFEYPILILLSTTGMMIL